jgi:hypothetical protein
LLILLTETLPKKANEIRFSVHVYLSDAAWLPTTPFPDRGLQINFRLADRSGNYQLGGDVVGKKGLWSRGVGSGSSRETPAAHFLWLWERRPLLTVAAVRSSHEIRSGNYPEGRHGLG